MTRPIGLVILALAILGIGFSVVRLMTDPYDIKTLREDAKIDDAWALATEAALQRVTNGTEFQDKWQINKEPKPGWLSIILIDTARKRANGVPPKLVRNCTYTGKRDTVICDIELARSFLGDRDLDKWVNPETDTRRSLDELAPIEELPDELLSKTRQYFLEWVLGHEIGHILAGHGESHFTASRLDEVVEPSSLSQKDELEADSFLAEQFSVAETTGDDAGFYFFLFSVLNTEVQMKACPDRSPVQHCNKLQMGMLIFSPNDYIRYSRKGTHPEYIIRMIRLLNLAGKRYEVDYVSHLAEDIAYKLREQEEAD